ncbi:MAG: ComF family protein [Bacteroidetes bacterium]|nr:MAG: ComF family protein [Bacteroidota bacterium]
MLSEVSHLFFPDLCCGCSSDLLLANQLLCFHCQNKLNETGFALIADNPVEKIWWGRVQVAAAMSQFYFTKESLLQDLIHQLKYKGNRELGRYLGKFMGQTLKTSRRFDHLDLIIPLPLFADKFKIRGYNQSTMLSLGIAEVLDLPVREDFIFRIRQTESQTHKTRMERWQNMEGVFDAKPLKEFSQLNVLIVDDVVTTGATLEACCAALLEEHPGCSVSIATLAYAEK